METHATNVGVVNGHAVHHLLAMGALRFGQLLAVTLRRRVGLAQGGDSDSHGQHKVPAKFAKAP